MSLLQKTIRVLDKVGVFSRWSNVIGIAVLFLMVCVTFVDVILRYIFNSPITGVVEVTEVMMILAIFLAVAHTQNEKGHVSIDLFTSKLNPKMKTAAEFINNLMGLGIFIIVIWRILAYAVLLVNDNAVQSLAAPIPQAPFAIVIAIGVTALSLLLVRDLLHNIAGAFKLGLTPHHWLLMIGVPALVTILAIFWMQPGLWDLSLPIVGLIGIIVTLLFFLGGMPIAFTLILTSFLFIGHIRGPETALQMLGMELYGSTGSYTWSVLPFFVLMGFICLYAKLGQDLYFAAYKWLGHWRGGMAIATVGACTAFAAIVGESVSATATMSAVALPEMRKYKYSDVLTTGSITGGATLGPIIPPSTSFIIYGLLTKLSIGDLFAAGIFPGMLIAVVFCVIIYGWCRINPAVGPPGERSAWKLRFLSLKSGGPVLVLFLLVVGGIYSGAFTPTEGGAIGAMVALFIGLAMRRFTRKSFIQTLQEGGKVVSMTFLILIGALMFTRFVAWCNLSATVAGFFIRFGLSPTIYVITVLMGLFILGCIMDLMPLLLIGVPILYPIATAMGINPIWFAVLTVIVINLGALTPPVGIILFVLKGMHLEIPMSVIYKGAIPFTLGTLVGVVILFLVPAISTWLPAAFR